MDSVSVQYHKYFFLRFISKDFAPEIVSISEYQLIHPNQPLVLECTSIGSPRPVLQWLHDGNIIVSFLIPEQNLHQ